MDSFIEQIKQHIENRSNGSILVHSDVLFGFKIKFESHQQFLSEHCEKILELAGSNNLVLPTFNYDFCKGKPFDVKNDPSTVGVLSEFYRQNYSKWRTDVPVFSFCGNGCNLIENTSLEIDPFDDKSVFGKLHNNKGLLFHYGSKFHTTTLIHYVERISGRLLYRYDKVFRGKVISENNNEKDVLIKYHVRPLGFPIVYDWERLENELRREEILFTFSNGRSHFIIAEISKLVDFWLNKIEKDNLYLLDFNTKNEVENKIDKLGRPFLISDFEKI